MGRKAKVRFYARANKFSAELLAVRELTCGDLIVSLKPNAFYEMGDGDLAAIREYRFTVHCSPASTGRTITSSLMLESGEVIRNVAFVDCTTGPFRWWIFSRRHPELNLPHFAMVAREKDTVLRVAKFDPGHTNLITHVVVADKGHLAEGPIDLPDWRHAGIGRFRHFDMFVLSRYLWLPSIGEGDNVVPLTSAQLPKGIRAPSDEQVEAHTLSPREVGERLIIAETWLGEKLKDRIIAIMAEAGQLTTPMEHAHLAGRISTCTDFPIE